MNTAGHPSASKIVFPHKYPIVKPSPTVDDCMRAFRPVDYIQCFGATVGCWTYGFMTGKPARFAMAGMMSTIGITFGTFVMIQNTRGRLMGFRENEREIKMYGASEIQ